MVGRRELLVSAEANAYPTAEIARVPTGFCTSAQLGVCKPFTVAMDVLKLRANAS
jgi:hypothetical protein